ncbi:hypothetical protein [Halocalculus aciditolerans]|uniref:Uncharacterized protein n=1 Tax=Halocalculus aciditolerans TaxID=1383812 RepID=A0A830FM50_9EURY|nr:hypothetical protein [Halocalculus aciditolerans]GGL69459.1 hypothetical protein GCM10009039_29250 [Halocalculus aciditolerans]
MTTQFDDVATRDEFRRRLSELISAASENDVRVEGGWTCESIAGNQWDVVVAGLDDAAEEE